MKKFISIIPLLCALTSCESTGDPNAGGYFGYSQKKNDTRQDGLRSELSFQQGKSKSLKAEQDALVSKRNSLRRQIAATQQRIETAPTQEAKVKANNDLTKLNRELALLESSM